MAALNTAELSIPVIDISNEDAKTGTELVDAVEKWGFVFVRGEGLGFKPQNIEDAFQLSRKFFSSSIEEKKKYPISPNNKGWSSPYSEVLDTDYSQKARSELKGDFKEAFNLGDFSSGKAQQPLPKSLADSDHGIDYFAVLCRKMCIKLLRHFARGLMIETVEGGQDWFTPRHDLTNGTSGSILRLLYYPPVQKDPDQNDHEIEIRAGAHSDYGSLTLLFQRPFQSGLEILKADGTWSPVPVFPKGTENDEFPPILVNIGDLLNHWTDGLLKSTVHRVVMPKSRREARYSIAYFCHPLDDTDLIPIPSERIRMMNFGKKKDLQSQKKVMTAAEHLKSRLAATYGWTAPSVQDEKGEKSQHMSET